VLLITALFFAAGCPGEGKPLPDGYFDVIVVADAGLRDGLADRLVDLPAADLAIDRSPDPDQAIDFSNPDIATDIARDISDDLTVDAGPPGSPCTDAAYSGFRCLTISHQSSRFPRPFSITLRWNVHHTAPNATVLWLLGNEGKGRFRVDTAMASVQDRLAASDTIRSLEVAYESSGGYFSDTPRGYIDASFVYSELLTKLSTMGLIAGAWTTHLGYSNGTMMGAAGLAHHGLAAQVERFIFIAGPFLTDMERECSDSSYYAYISDPKTRNLLDQWNGWSIQQTCELSKTVANPPYATRSLLGPGALKSYPNVSINVLIGDQDEFGPWVLHSNQIWYEAISAGEKSKHVLSGIGHLVLGGPAAPKQPTQVILDMIYGYAKRPPRAPLNPKPELIFSATLDGPAQKTFALGATVHGRTIHIGPNAQGCMENGASNIGTCNVLSAWTTMPNTEWRYDTQTQRWRSAFVPQSLGMTAGSYRGFWRNLDTQQHTDLVELELTQ
jgi:hypothetical protein